jgi:aryl-alcohol dehydrogenase
MEIRAAVTESKGAPYAIQPVELAEPQAGEVLVRVAASGICHTDLIIRDQWYPVPLPAVLGHEGAGLVERVGPGVTLVAPGDHVAMSYDSCGACPKCLVGRPFHCHDFFGYNFGATRPDGTTALSRGGDPVHSHFFGQSSFATHAIARERNVVKLDPSLPLEVIAPFGCGIQTGAGAVLNVLHPHAGTSLAVFGTGTVGLAAIMAARVAGCTRIVGIDIRPERLELARELGATEVVQAGEPVEGVDFALETTGHAEVLRTAVYSTGPGGVTGIIGAPPFGTEVSLGINEMLTMGRTVCGIVEGESVPAVFIPRLIELWRQGRFPVDRMMRTYEFDELDAAAHDAEEGRVVKAVVRMP